MISLPKPPKIIERKDNEITFVIEDLYPGYGVTIGNALRRVLFSSLSGAAVTKVKIKSVQHEFTTLPGVLEDVVNICLNLKKLRFKIHSDEAQEATLKVSGEKDVTGADFKLPSQIELINKDLHIATLTDKKATLEMDVLVQKGIGYEPREMRQKEKPEIGEISLDAIYTPIENVSYKVENMRVGERTDFDRLSITIKVDGTISPEQALISATEILINHFSLIFKEKDVLTGEMTEKKVKKIKVVKKVKKAKDKSKKILKEKKVSKKKIEKPKKSKKPTAKKK